MVLLLPNQNLTSFCDDSQLLRGEISLSHVTCLNLSYRCRVTFSATVLPTTGVICFSPFPSSSFCSWLRSFFDPRHQVWNPTIICRHQTSQPWGFGTKIASPRSRVHPSRTHHLFIRMTTKVTKKGIRYGYMIRYFILHVWFQSISTLLFPPFLSFMMRLRYSKGRYSGREVQNHLLLPCKERWMTPFLESRRLWQFGFSRIRLSCWNSFVDILLD